MSFIDKIKGLLPGKKEEEVSEPFPAPVESSLPSDLEQFRQPPQGLPEPELTTSEPMTPAAPLPLEEQKIDVQPYPKAPTLPEPIKEEPSEDFNSDKTEIIISKLDTIDSRLKLIEERLKK